MPIGSMSSSITMTSIKHAQKPSGYCWTSSAKHKQTGMQHIGLFFGSFNPIHTGHLIIANYMANYTALDEVWLVVTPHNPLKKKDSLINQYDRLEMVNLAIEKTENIRSSTIEFSLPQPSYTIDTLAHLREKYPEKAFALIMGSDNLVSFHKWKNYEVILRDYRVLV